MDLGGMESNEIWAAAALDVAASTCCGLPVRTNANAAIEHRCFIDDGVAPRDVGLVVVVMGRNAVVVGRRMLYWTVVKLVTVVNIQRKHERVRIMFVLESIPAVWNPKLCDIFLF